MKKILRLLEPRTMSDVIVRVTIFVGLMTCGNLLFLETYGQRHIHPLLSAWAQTVLVVGPFIAFFFVISMLQARQMRRLYRRSRKDGLTGLDNRSTFLNVTKKRLDTSVGGVVLLLDADFFKQINDNHGHQSGDNCLKSIAKALKENLRQNDIVGRIGGEEFAVFLSYTTMRQAKIIAERFTKPIAFKSAATEEKLTITMSVGAAEVEPGLTLDELLARADTCLYRAKAEGRARLVVWPETPMPNPLTAAE